MASLAFITPAFHRETVSRLVAAQRRVACDELERRGHRVTTIVVADDANLNIAEDHGFIPVDCPNKPFGRKWNVGYAAAAEWGADYVMPIGSDSLLDPELPATWLALRPNVRRISFTRYYAVIHPTGRRRADCYVTTGGGGGMMLSMRLLEPLGYAPVDPELDRGCDGSTLRNVRRYRDVQLVPRDVHPLAVVAVQTRMQITPYERLLSKWGEREQKPALVGLADVYGEETYDSLRELYRLSA